MLALHLPAAPSLLAPYAKDRTVVAMQTLVAHILVATRAFTAPTTA